MFKKMKRARPARKKRVLDGHYDAFQIGLSATKKNPVQLQNVLRAQLVRFDILLKLQSLSLERLSERR